jgi:hypothetical protein
MLWDAGVKKGGHFALSMGICDRIAIHGAWYIILASSFITRPAQVISSMVWPKRLNTTDKVRSNALLRTTLMLPPNGQTRNVVILRQTPPITGAWEFMDV